MARQGIKRKLDAILVADAVGFSRLAEADEAGAYARLKAHLSELNERTIAEHDGRIIKSTGDGMLIAFASVVGASGSLMGSALAVVTDRDVCDQSDN